MSQILKASNIFPGYLFSTTTEHKMRRFGTTTNKLPLQQFRRPPRTPVISRFRIADMGYISNPQAESTVRDWGFPSVCTFVDEPFVTHFHPFDRLSTPLGRNRHQKQQGWQYLTCACLSLPKRTNLGLPGSYSTHALRAADGLLSLPQPITNPH
jgi:hypothetical protein